MARSTARKRALNTLYEADIKRQPIQSLLQERLAFPGAPTPLPEYAVEILRGVADHRRHIDDVISEHSKDWSLSRMAKVDRNILRLATWEIVYNPEVPAKVVIDEAIALAKRLSEADSAAFIHGVLSAIADDPTVGPEETEADEAESSESELDEKPSGAEGSKRSDGSETPEAPSSQSLDSIDLADLAADDSTESQPEALDD